MLSLFASYLVLQKTLKPRVVVQQSVLHVQLNLFMQYVNNKGAYQPVHLHSLISAFVFAA